ncbi:MAG: malto-oligosyltrehalose trehalohydrolase [Acidobacteria bacterium]|nr:malto-oligosyltrehalose trehalohydrolase [Acidobacteriota bacterium]
MGWQPTLGAWLEAGGVRFRVWAPEREHVDLVLDGPDRRDPIPLEPADGYWTVLVPGVGAGALYRYRLDGTGPFPDPASRSQPGGVHGPSRVVNPGAFQWGVEEWPVPTLEELVLYELHVGTFTPPGTFAAAAERLEDLRELGVTAVELMPLAEFPGQRNWGYDGVDLFAPARVYGTPDDLRRLVDRAHALGLAMILDVVYNHVGPAGSYLDRFSSRYFSSSRRTPWGPAFNLDGEGSGPVRELLIENARHWIHEYRFDGLRFDACRTLVDHSPRHLLAEMQARVRESAAPRAVLMIAEDSRNLVEVVQPEAEGGWGLDAVWADDLHHQLRVSLAGDRGGYYRDFSGSLEDTARTLGDGWFFQGQVSEHFGGPRGTDPWPVAPRHFVVYLQNHDQIGNRAVGERLHHQVDAAAWRAVSVLLLLAPETPLLFMGQEWGASSPFLFFTDHDEPLGRQVGEGRKRELRDFAAYREAAIGGHVPDPQAETTFTRSRLGWPERGREPHASLLRLYRAALALRRERGLGRLERRDYRVTGEGGELVLEAKPPGSDPILVVVRLGGAGVLEPEDEDATSPGRARGWRVLLSTEQAEFAGDPRPPRVGVESPRPRVDFHRAGAVVLTRA